MHSVNFLLPQSAVNYFRGPFHSGIRHDWFGSPGFRENLKAGFLTSACAE